VQCFVDDCFLFINGNLVDSLEKKKESKSDSYYAAVLANTNDANNTRVSGYLNQIEVYSGISPYQAVVSYMNCSDFIANWDPAKTLVHWTQFLAAFPPEDKSTPGQCETLRFRMIRTTRTIRTTRAPRMFPTPSRRILIESLLWPLIVRSRSMWSARTD
ncbi:hypothetical protein PENTCL1PPCAC_30538, partial [Pristionchus entomophagus]